jgi:hypothetical protein
MADAVRSLARAVDLLASELPDRPLRDLARRSREQAEEAAASVDASPQMALDRASDAATSDDQRRAA